MSQKQLINCSDETSGIVLAALVVHIYICCMQMQVQLLLSD